MDSSSNRTDFSPPKGSKQPHRSHVTIYDIARRAGTSPSTVSMVLNNKWQAQRIRAETAQHIQSIAADMGYSVNLRARALRLDRSGLAGMIIPHYQSRFWSSLAEAFQVEAHRRNLCPVVVNTNRDQRTERAMTKILLAHKVELLFIAGVNNPAPLNQMCQREGVHCINIDLPGPDAPSVVADNRTGARMLTEKLLNRMPPSSGKLAERMFFVGGIADEYATDERLIGFHEIMSIHGLTVEEDQIDLCGYEPEVAMTQIEALYRRYGRLPSGIFVNSCTIFDGVVQFFTTLPRSAVRNISIGCFDWDPIATFLPFPVLMVRQDAGQMIADAFAMIDSFDDEPAHTRVMVPTHLVEA